MTARSWKEWVEQKLEEAKDLPPAPLYGDLSRPRQQEADQE